MDQIVDSRPIGRQRILHSLYRSYLSWNTGKRPPGRYQHNDPLRDGLLQYTLCMISYLFFELSKVPSKSSPIILSFHEAYSSSFCYCSQ